MARTALLVLDMFNLFDYPDGPALARAARRIAPAILRLRAHFDRADAPVIHVNDNFADWRGDFGDLVGACLAGGGDPAAIAGRLAPGPGHYYILKPKHSAFMCTALPVLLAQLGVERLAIAGIAADACVLATAQDANMREFEVWVPSDCVAARDPAAKRRALALLAGSTGARTAASGQVRGVFPAGAGAPPHASKRS